MHPYQSVALDTGAILLTPCPGTKETTIEAAIEELKAAGATTLITMMQPAELEKHEVTAIPEVCTKLGITWYHFPVEDDHSPRETTQQLIDENKAVLINKLNQGETIAVHCKGGQGRTGLMAAILMLENGYSWDETKKRIQAVKPKSLTLAPHLAYIAEKY